jgi:hypothetical protein
MNDFAGSLLTEPSKGADMPHRLIGRGPCLATRRCGRLGRLGGDHFGPASRGVVTVIAARMGNAVSREVAANGGRERYQA